jgi:hypothetical protein
LPAKDHTYFGLLKSKIVSVMQESYPGISPVISEWKGQEITDFQEDLRIRVNANISEKWFYTHMKSSHPSLPRIDLLNLLSKYAGYANWDDFVFKNQDLIPTEPDKIKSSNRYFIIIPTAVLFIVGILYVLFIFLNTRNYHFTFQDADTHETIQSKNIVVKLLEPGESPANYSAGADGMLHLKTDKSKVTMIVSAPYYQTDTFVRTLKKFNRNEIILLHANDYSLMIHYFSTQKVDDWERRKKHLDDIFDENVAIYQVLGDKEATGMALYNKQEFIDKMTMPSGSLRDIEVLDSRLRNNKICLLRFRINHGKR